MLTSYMRPIGEAWLKYLSRFSWLLWTCACLVLFKFYLLLTLCFQSYCEPWVLCVLQNNVYYILTSTILSGRSKLFLYRKVESAPLHLYAKLQKIIGLMFLLPLHCGEKRNPPSGGIRMLICSIIYCIEYRLLDLHAHRVGGTE